MENRYVGLIIMGFAILMLLVIFSYNNALEEIVTTSCTHGEACPMHTTVSTQKAISYGLASILILGGLFVFFFLKDTKDTTPGVTHQTVEKRDFSDIDTSGLSEDEKKLVDALIFAKGSSYQSDMIKETKLSKVKITRILDKLEGKGLVDRKRRGMTNIVILK